MLNRCYNKTQQATYVGCTVSEKWHRFSDFKKWHDANYVDGWELDKDILVPGNKVYGPEFCVYVPQYLNALLTLRGNHRGDCALGVKRHKRVRDFAYVAQITFLGRNTCLGSYETEHEAHMAWQFGKIAQIAMALSMYRQEKHFQKVVVKAFRRRMKQLQKHALACDVTEVL